MKIIFLDIDGVISARPPKPTMRRIPGDARIIRRLPTPRVPDSRKIQRPLHRVPIGHLNRIGAEAGASIVVTSSWRLAEDVRARLTAAGLDAPFHEDWRTDEGGPDRGAEISRWLHRNGPCDYVVLDDWPRGLEPHFPRLVRPDYRTGLGWEDAEAAIAILQGRDGRFLAGAEQLIE